MINNNQIFLRSKGKVSLPKGKPVLLKDLAEISADEEIKSKLENLYYPVDTKKEVNVLISVLSMITFIKENISNVDLVVIGQTDVLINFNDKNEWDNTSQVPPNTELSSKISKDLKKRGFRFVGSTVIYSHLQAAGLVNDHIKDCFRYNNI